MTLGQGARGCNGGTAADREPSLGAGAEGFNAKEAGRFLRLLGKDRAAAWLRFLDPLKQRRGGADHQGVSSTADLAVIRAKEAERFNVYMVIGNADTIAGRNVKDTDISSIPALFVEWDDGAGIEAQAQRWRELGLPEPSVMVTTGGKSVHCYWVLEQPMAPEPWKVLTKRLIAHCNSDSSCCNPSRVMRLPGGTYYSKDTGEATGRCRIIGGCEARYSVDAIAGCLPPPAPLKPAAAQQRADWAPRGIDEINAAAEYIPRRVGGEGTYEQDRNALCGCARALAEAGVADPDAAALALLGHLWPTEADARQVLASTTTRNAASFWAIAKEHGYGLKRTGKTAKTVKTYARTGGTPSAATPPASIAGFIHQLPDGWVVDEETGVRKQSGLSVGHLADLLESLPQQLRFNEMTMFVEVETTSGWVAMRDADMNSAYVLLSQKGWVIGADPVIKAVCHVARQQSFHPVRQYLLGLEQDTSTAAFDLDEVAPRFFRSPDPLHVAMVRKWLIGAVWRAMEPGCQMDYCLVLQSRHQGIGKTTSFKALASPDWFNSTAPDGDKDFLLNVHSCWIFEMGELESHTGKRSAGHMKNLITITTDNFRAPYGKNNEPHRRGSVFCGTVNEDTFLRDETGNRRYWVVPIDGTEPLDRDGLKAARDGIWKAALAAWRDGEIPMLTRAQEALSEIQNGEFVQSDPWAEMVRAWMDGDPMHRWDPERDPSTTPYKPNEPFTSAEVLYSAGLRRPDQITRADQMRVGAVLRQLGFETKQRRQGGEVVRLWCRTAPALLSRPVTTCHDLSDRGCDTPNPLRQNDLQQLSRPSQPFSSEKLRDGSGEGQQHQRSSTGSPYVAKKVVTVVTPPANPSQEAGSGPSQPFSGGCDTLRPLPAKNPSADRDVSCHDLSRPQPPEVVTPHPTRPIAVDGQPGWTLPGKLPAAPTINVTVIDPAGQSRCVQRRQITEVA